MEERTFSLGYNNGWRHRLDPYAYQWFTSTYLDTYSTPTRLNSDPLPLLRLLFFFQVLLLRHLWYKPHNNRSEQTYTISGLCSCWCTFQLRNILPQSCEKHIQTRFPFSNFGFGVNSITQAEMLCHVSVHRVLSDWDRARDPISVAFFDQVALFPDSNGLFELLGPGFARYSCNAFYILK